MKLDMCCPDRYVLDVYLVPVLVHTCTAAAAAIQPIPLYLRYLTFTLVQSRTGIYDTAAAEACQIQRAEQTELPTPGGGLRPHEHYPLHPQA